MSVCPICQNHHQEKVSKCQRCNWSMQENLDSIEIGSEHPLLKIYIPKLVQYFEDENKILRSHLQTLNLELQKDNNQKLSNILDAIEESNQKQNETFKAINKLFIELKSLIVNKYYPNNLGRISDEPTVSTENLELLTTTSNSHSLSCTGQPELDKEISTDSYLPSNNSTTSTEFAETNNDNNVFSIEKERDFSTNTNHHEPSDLEEYSRGSYQSFYDLIRQGELTVIEVKLSQETMEKMRIGTENNLIFVNDRKGNYWIVNWHEVYCLIPKEKSYINQYQYDSLQKIFDCQRYQEDYSNFEVIEPATVFKYDLETWQLERKGKIQFI